MTQGQFLIGAIFSIGLGAAAVFVAGPVSDGCCPLTGEPLGGPAVKADCCPSIKEAPATTAAKTDDCCPSMSKTAAKPVSEAKDSCCDAEPTTKPNAKPNAKVAQEPKAVSAGQVSTEPKTDDGKDKCCDSEAPIQK